MNEPVVMLFSLFYGPTDCPVYKQVLMRKWKQY